MSDRSEVTIIFLRKLLSFNLFTHSGHEFIHWKMRTVNQYSVLYIGILDQMIYKKFSLSIYNYIFDSIIQTMV